jgi:hypothetical protein
MKHFLNIQIPFWSRKLCLLEQQQPTTNVYMLTLRVNIYFSPQHKEGSEEKLQFFHHSIYLIDTVELYISFDGELKDLDRF